MTGKVALITAGGSGMGAAAARRLAEDGFRVAILSSSGKGEALANDLGGIGVTGSNQSNDDLKRLVDAATGAWGRIDVLVNSAGHGPRAPVLDLTDEDWHKGMEVYFLNVVRPTRLVTPIMAAQKSGVIVNISTFAAFEPDPVFPTSGVFRAGLAAFTKLFADRYAGDNIRMNNVLPGFIDSLPEKEEFRSRIPMGRYGHEGEIAATVAFLASDDLVVSVLPVTDEQQEPDGPGSSFVISVHGADRVGIVAAITGAIASYGGNVTDLQTRLGGGLYVVVAEVDFAEPMDAEVLTTRLRAVGQTVGVDVAVQPADQDVL